MNEMSWTEKMANDRAKTKVAKTSYRLLKKAVQLYNMISKLEI